MMPVTVLTACYGDRDRLREQPEQTIPCRFVAVTDRAYESDTWTCIVEPRPHLSPRMAAKLPKMMPWGYADTRRVVWIDASGQLLRNDSIEEILYAARGAKLALWPHPDRKSVWEELAVAKATGKYAGQMLDDQVNYYLNSGLEDSSLYATGLLVWKLHDRSVSLGAAWVTETLRWSVCDQISLPFILQAEEIEPRLLPASLWYNSWVKFQR